MTKSFKEKKFILVSNFHTYGIQHALKDYLLAKGVKEVSFINHPLHGVSSDLYSTLEIFTGKKHKLQKKIRRNNLPEVLNYFIDLFITLYFALSQPGGKDVYVGFNSMNTLAGIILRFFGKTKFLITYSHSYKQERYNNNLLNQAYRIVDGVAVKSSDSVWGLGMELVDIRKKQGVPGKKAVYVPDGVDIKRFKNIRVTAGNRYRLVFVGLLNEINGIELTIDSMPKLIKWNKSVTLDIVGDGEERAKLEKKVKELGIKNNVFFHGILSIEEISKKLPRYGIGIATYKPLKDSTLKTTDPMKTKLYMASGLPIISTNLYSTADEIEKHSLGKLIKYDVDEFVSSVKYLSKISLYTKISKNCLEFAKKYDWRVIFDNAFTKTFG